MNLRHLVSLSPFFSDLRIIPVTSWLQVFLVALAFNMHPALSATEKWFLSGLSEEVFLAAVDDRFGI